MSLIFAPVSREMASRRISCSRCSIPIPMSNQNQGKQLSSESPGRWVNLYCEKLYIRHNLQLIITSPSTIDSQLLLFRLAVHYHMLLMFLYLHHEVSPEGARSSVKFLLPLNDGADEKKYNNNSEETSTHTVSQSGPLKP